MKKNLLSLLMLLMPMMALAQVKQDGMKIWAQVDAWELCSPPEMEAINGYCLTDVDGDGIYEAIVRDVEGNYALLSCANAKGEVVASPSEINVEALALTYDQGEMSVMDGMPYVMISGVEGPSRYTRYYKIEKSRVAAMYVAQSHRGVEVVNEYRVVANGTYRELTQKDFLAALPEEFVDKFVSELDFITIENPGARKEEAIKERLANEIKTMTPLVVAPPAHFNGIELPINNAKKITLTTLGSKENGITDDDLWINAHEGGMPYRHYWFGDITENALTQNWYRVPLTLGNDLWRGDIEIHEDYIVFAYGEHKYDRDVGYDTNYLVITDRAVEHVKAVIDFRSVGKAFSEKVFGESDRQGFSQFADLEFTGYTVEGDIAYVAAAHRTYASSSKGKNAYLMAINIKTGKIKWMTKPLTCNSQFCILGNSIICGYGFSGESHYVYVVDKNTGRRAQTIWVKKSPELISIEGKKAYIRTYSYDYTFSIK